MKGRIAYLPVDVAANASFVPDNILNLDSFVLLVGGQPTKQKSLDITGGPQKSSHSP